MTTARQQLEIALRAHKSPRTVARAYGAGKTHETTLAAIDEAARALGYAQPPRPTSQGGKAA